MLEKVKEHQKRGFNSTLSGLRVVILFIVILLIAIYPIYRYYNIKKIKTSKDIIILDRIYTTTTKNSSITLEEYKIIKKCHLKPTLKEAIVCYNKSLKKIKDLKKFEDDLKKYCEIGVKYAITKSKITRDICLLPYTITRKECNILKTKQVKKFCKIYLEKKAINCFKINTSSLRLICLKEKIN